MIGSHSNASIGSLKIIDVNPLGDPRWTNFVVEHPSGSIYHHPLWLAALGREYKQEGLHLACTDEEGRFLAVLPMLYTRGVPLGLGGRLAARRLSSLPRTPLAGPLSIDSSATARLVLTVMSRVQDDSKIEVQIKSDEPDLQGMNGFLCAPWRLTYRLKLPHYSDGPFRIAKSHERARIKWALNKAKRMGVHARIAETEADVARWYNLYLDTMRRNAVPPRPYRFFAALWRLLRPNGLMELILAEQHSPVRRRLIAGSIFLKFNRTVSYAFNGSRDKDWHLRPNEVIQWHAINDACNRGYETMDFGEVDTGDHELAKFKMKWGAEPTRLYRYYLVRNHNSQDNVDGPSSFLANMSYRVWRRLPLRTTAWIGDRIYNRL